MEYCEIDINFSVYFKAKQETDTVVMLLNNQKCIYNGLPTLSSIDFMIHLCLHLFKEATVFAWVEMRRDLSLYKFCDIYLLMNNQTNESFYIKLEERIVQLEMQKECYYALIYTKNLFDIQNERFAQLITSIMPKSVEYLNEVIDPARNKKYRYDDNFIDFIFYGNRKERLYEIKMKPNNYPGKLITVCGLDGCGKTTQINYLAKFIEQQNKKVFLTKQPSDFIRNSEIFRNFMDMPEHDEFDYRALSLFAASDRIQHSNKVITKHLADGDIVISDRYFYSCLANLRARGFTDDKWIYEIAEFIIEPDVAFFLNEDVETAISRVRQRENEKNRYIDVELQYKLRDEYLNIAKENDGIIIGTCNSEADSLTCILRTVAYSEKLNKEERYNEQTKSDFYSQRFMFLR